MRVAVVLGMCASTACQPHWEVSCYQLRPPEPRQVVPSSATLPDIRRVLEDDERKHFSPPPSSASSPPAPTMQCTRIRYHCGAIDAKSPGCRGIDGRTYPIGCLTETPPGSCGGVLWNICTDLALIPSTLSYFDYDFELEENKLPVAHGAPHWQFAGLVGPGCFISR